MSENRQNKKNELPIYLLRPLICECGVRIYSSRRFGTKAEARVWDWLQRNKHRCTNSNDNP